LIPFRRSNPPVGKIAPLRKLFMRQAGADLGALPSLMAREG